MQLIFFLSDASGICWTILPHLSSLSDWTASRIKGGEKRRYTQPEIQSFRERGSKKSNRLRERGICSRGEWCHWHECSNVDLITLVLRCWWMPESGGERQRCLRGSRGSAEEERGKPKWKCAREHHVMTRFRATCLRLNAALDSSLHFWPVCLLEREAELKRQPVWMEGRARGESSRGGAGGAFDTVKGWHKAYACRSAQSTSVVTHCSTGYTPFVFGLLFLPGWIL